MYIGYGNVWQEKNRADSILFLMLKQHAPPADHQWSRWWQFLILSEEEAMVM